MTSRLKGNIQQWGRKTNSRSDSAMDLGENRTTLLHDRTISDSIFLSEIEEPASEEGLSR